MTNMFILEVPCRAGDWEKDPKVVRIGLAFDSNGAATELILAVGRGRASAWREDPKLGGVEFPAAMLVPLRDALTNMEQWEATTRPRLEKHDG